MQEVEREEKTQETWEYRHKQSLLLYSSKTRCDPHIWIQSHRKGLMKWEENKGDSDSSSRKEKNERVKICRFVTQTWISCTTLWDTGKVREWGMLWESTAWRYEIHFWLLSVWCLLYVQWWEDDYWTVKRKYICYRDMDVWVCSGNLKHRSMCNILDIYMILWW